jgi:hypothetical protein
VVRRPRSLRDHGADQRGCQGPRPRRPSFRCGEPDDEHRPSGRGIQVPGRPRPGPLGPTGPTPTSSPAGALAAPLAGTKQDALPILRRLAAAGFVAVSLDSWQHGQRGTEPGEQVAQRVFGNFRRHLWPILGQTTLDALRVTDWAMATLGSGPGVVAGGVSVGGDVAVALAGIDQRVSRVGAIVATPGWTRSATSTPTRAARRSPSSAAPTTPTSRPMERCASRPPCARPTRPWPSGSGSPYTPVSGTWMGRSTRHWHGTAWPGSWNRQLPQREGSDGTLTEPARLPTRWLSPANPPLPSSRLDPDFAEALQGGLLTRRWSKHRRPGAPPPDLPK